MPQLVRLVGIARLASEGSLLTQKRSVQYRSLPTRKWLNRCHSKRVPFHWSINPYRGCEYGCKYCYARFTHEFLERPDAVKAFETEIYAKDWNEDAFRRELKSVQAGQIIGIGTATDPYQPVERHFGLTHQVLEAMTSLSQASVFITTKSDLSSRDATLLMRLAERNKVCVTVTVTTMDCELARLLEPYAPRPDLRMEAVAELARAGVNVGVIASPVLPLITDSTANLEGVARAAVHAGASHFGANVVFLQPAARSFFFPFLAEAFPQHLTRYQHNFGTDAYLRGKYPEHLRAIVEDIRSRVGIGKRDLSSIALPRPASAQIRLF